MVTFITVRSVTYLLRERAIGRAVPQPRWSARATSTTSCPGIALAFASGGVAIVTRNETLERWMALPFGAGMGLTLDESALLLELDDVYWSEEGILSVQITLAVTALLAATALAARVLLRGEQEVLPGQRPTGRAVGCRRWRDQEARGPRARLPGYGPEERGRRRADAERRHGPGGAAAPPAEDPPAPLWSAPKNAEPPPRPRREAAEPRPGGPQSPARGPQAQPPPRSRRPAPRRRRPRPPATAAPSRPAAGSSPPPRRRPCRASWPAGAAASARSCSTA